MLILPDPTVPLHPEDLQGNLKEDQPGSESRYQTLNQTGEPGQPVGLFPPGVQDHCDLKIKGGRYRDQENINLLG